MPNYQPPPTYADPVLVELDPATKLPKGKFNPIWLKWFLDLAETLGVAVGADGVIDHESLGGLLGGAASDHYHITAAQRTDLTDAGDSALHFHATDRARANHTGTQAFSTISDGASTTYTPTRSAESNLDSNVTPSEAQYIRAGATVMVSGAFTADPTAGGAASFELSLPIPSNLGAVEDLAGVAYCGGIAGQGARISGSVANDTAVFSWVAVDTTSQSWSYFYMYQII